MLVGCQGSFLCLYFLHVSEHSEHIYVFYFYDGDRINYFQRGGVTIFIQKNLTSMKDNLWSEKTEPLNFRLSKGFTLTAV